MSGSNCSFLTCIHISQEAGKVIWYSHLLNNFPQFIVIHTIKGFGIVNKAKIDVFLEFSCFFNDPTDIGNLISDSAAFSKISLNIWKFMVHILLKPALENFEHYFAGVRDECNCAIPHLDPDILECEVKWALGSISMNKASGGDGIPVELFQILKDDAVKVLHSTCQQI